MLRKIIKYFKHMWSYHCHLLKHGDEDWDYTFLYSLLSWKLGRMADYAEKHGIVLSSTRQAKQMRYAMRLIELFEKDPKQEEERAAVVDKWGEMYFERQETPPEHPRATQIKIKYKKAHTEEQQKQASLDFNTAYHRSEGRKLDAHKRLWRHMETYVRGWWD